MRHLVRAFVCAGALLGLATPAATAASEPAVVTGTATAITSTSATLKGVVNPKGQATSYYFQYGTTTAYGSQTSVGGGGSGTATVDVSATTCPLTPYES